MQQEEIQAKIVLVGDSGSGKSSIIYRYKHKTFNSKIDSTIGASFYSHSLEISKKQVRLSIWDTAGQERYDSITSLYSRNSNAVIIVADCTRFNEIETIKKWYSRLMLNLDPDDVIILIAINKIDLCGNKEFPDIEEFAKGINATVYKTSAKDDIGINEMLIEVGNRIIGKNREFEKASFALSLSKGSKSIIKSKKECCKS